ncbi:VirD4-like conjugal transfer protein, CD1115 family [Candidatus Agathobaculum pullicola]|uniref:VirD4-like conjugal transfer protein, CD1115 family n=1 Tax=Candidatus Agathobaculum pullicola TaxID=2838426 RepID=UPI003F90A342
MRPDKSNMPSAALWAALAILVIWFGLLCGGAAAPGRTVSEWFDALSLSMEDPLHITITEYSVKAVLIILLVYLLCVFLFIDGQGKRRPGEEHGSAKWGKAKPVCAKYRYQTKFMERLKARISKAAAFFRSLPVRLHIKRLTPEGQARTQAEQALHLPCDMNFPLTQNVCIGLDVYRHKRNLNICAVGGAGAGKSRSLAKPGLMQANCSFLTCDPAGELLRDCAPLLLKRGYDIKVFNLSDRRRSDCYNPFDYIHSDADVIRLVTLLVRNTTPKGANSSDPFWEKAETALITALILYLYHEGAEEDKNFGTVMYLLNNAEAVENGPKSPTDQLFLQLEAEKGDSHIAVQYYKSFLSSPEKTRDTIRQMATSRLAYFLLDEMQDITGTDEMDFASLGERKRAIFVITPVNDKSFNYLVSMMYMQAFQELYDCAEKKHGGTLPVHVRFLMDEFANVPLPEDFEQTLATCRKYNISCTIILQNIAQLKGMFEKTWENITGNCDTFLYLGGNEQSTHKYVSELLGKATIDTRTSGQTRGSHGSYTRNFQQTGRELMTPDEVRELDNKYALLFIRGEHPVCDLKYDLLRHPALALTADGKAAPYTPPLRFPIRPSTRTDEWKAMKEMIDGIEFEYFSI